MRGGLAYSRLGALALDGGGKADPPLKQRAISYTPAWQLAGSFLGRLAAADMVVI